MLTAAPSNQVAVLGSHFTSPNASSVVSLGNDFQLVSPMFIENVRLIPSYDSNGEFTMVDPSKISAGRQIEDSSGNIIAIFHKDFHPNGFQNFSQPGFQEATINQDESGFFGELLKQDFLSGVMAVTASIGVGGVIGRCFPDLESKLKESKEDQAKILKSHVQDSIVGASLGYLGVHGLGLLLFHFPPVWVPALIIAGCGLISTAVISGISAHEKGLLVTKKINGLDAKDPEDKQIPSLKEIPVLNQVREKTMNRIGLAMGGAAVGAAIGAVVGFVVLPVIGIGGLITSVGSVLGGGIASYFGIQHKITKLKAEISLQKDKREKDLLKDKQDKYKGELQARLGDRLLFLEGKKALFECSLGLGSDSAEVVELEADISGTTLACKLVEINDYHSRQDMVVILNLNGIYN